MFDWLRHSIHTHRYREDFEKRHPEFAIKHLVFECDDEEFGEVMIWIDYEIDLDWFRDTRADKNAARRGCDVEIYEIVNGVSALEPCVQNWPKDLKLADCSKKISRRNHVGHSRHLSLVFSVASVTSCSDNLTGLPPLLRANP